MLVARTKFMKIKRSAYKCLKALPLALVVVPFYWTTPIAKPKLPSECQKI